MEKNAKDLKFYHEFIKNGINIMSSPLQLKPSMQ